MCCSQTHREDSKPLPPFSNEHEKTLHRIQKAIIRGVWKVIKSKWTTQEKPHLKTIIACSVIYFYFRPFMSPISDFLQMGSDNGQLPEELFSPGLGKSFPWHGALTLSVFTLLFQPQRHSQNPQRHSQNPKNWESLCQGKSEEPKRRRSSGRNSSLCLWGFRPISMVRICRSDHDWHKQYTMVQIFNWGAETHAGGGGVAHAGNWSSSPEALKLRYWNHNPREVVQDLSLKSNWTDCQD